MLFSRVATSSQPSVQLPLSAGACRHAGCETKASRHAVTPQLRPQDKVSLPVASFVALSGRDGTNKVWCLSRSSRRAATTGRKPTTAGADEIGSLPLKGNYESRASDDVLRGVGQGRAVTSCAGMRPTARIKDKFARSDKSTLCDIKLAAKRRQRAAPARGTPRDPVPGIL